MPKWTALAFAALLLLSVVPSRAQTPATDDFYPVLAKFDGHSALSYPPSVALELGAGATIEFWVYADWTDDPGYDPGIMSYTGPGGAQWAFLITADRKSFEVVAGSQAAKVPADFGDGLLHHVAIIALGDSLDVVFDDLPVGRTGFGFADMPVTDLWVGAYRGVSFFKGEIGNIRFWDVPVAPSVLMAHAHLPIYSSGPNAHPNFADLAGLSTFGNPETGGFLFLNTPNMVNPTLPLPPGPDATPADTTSAGQ